MFGPNSDVGETIEPSTGLVLRVCDELLKGKESLAAIGISLTLSAQFVEIYNEKLTDLLTGAEAAVRCAYISSFSILQC